MMHFSILTISKLGLWEPVSYENYFMTMILMSMIGSSIIFYMGWDEDATEISILKCSAKA